MTTATVPITFRALQQRLNRHLAKSDAILKKARGRYATQVGAWYVVNGRVNRVEQCHVEPVALARELGVLAAWETVVEGETDGQ
jgi:hypothetical protein